MLKPVRGVDRGAYENFASMCVLDYPKYEIVFAVGEADDPIIQALQRDFQETQRRLIVGVEQLGACNKTNNLCRLAREARYELLVMNDSDVRVVKDYLRAVTAPFRDAKVGVVTAFSVASPIADSLRSWMPWVFPPRAHPEHHPRRIPGDA
jgi:ceramide glucosyltransferase